MEPSGRMVESGFALALAITSSTDTLDPSNPPVVFAVRIFSSVLSLKPLAFPFDVPAFSLFPANRITLRTAGIDLLIRIARPAAASVETCPRRGASTAGAASVALGSKSAARLRLSRISSNLAEAKGTSIVSKTKRSTSPSNAGSRTPPSCPEGSSYEAQSRTSCCSSEVPSKGPNNSSCSSPMPSHLSSLSLAS